MERATDRPTSFDAPDGHPHGEDQWDPVYARMLTGSAKVDLLYLVFRNTAVCLAVRAAVPPYAPLAQLDRASGYEPGGRTFESCRARFFPKHSVN